MAHVALSILAVVRRRRCGGVGRQTGPLAVRRIVVVMLLQGRLHAQRVLRRIRSRVRRRRLRVPIAGQRAARRAIRRRLKARPASTCLGEHKCEPESTGMAT